MTLGIYKGQKNWRATRFGYSFEEREQYATVIRAFWLYNKLKKAVDIYKEDMIASVYKGGTVTGQYFPRSAGTHSSPTEQAAELIAVIPEITIDVGKPTEEVILRPDLCVQTVEKTIFVLTKEDEIAAEILRRRYLTNESMAVSCYELNVSKDKYYRKHNRGIVRGRDVGIQVGLIKIF